MTAAASEHGDVVAVYRLYDDESNLLYVGCTTRPQERFQRHASTKSWWPDVARHEIQWHATIHAGRTAEALAIRAERPRYNRIVRSATPPGGASFTLQEPRNPATLNAIHEAAIDAVRAMPNRAVALKAAQALTEDAARLRSQAADLRAELAHGLQEEGVSLQGIADLIEVTRATAQNILGKKPVRRSRDDAH